MLITCEYIRLNYTGGSDKQDAVLEQCIRAAIGEVRTVIGQPVVETEHVWHFTGNGGTRFIYPFNLKVDTESIEVEYRPSLQDDWEAVSDIEYERPYIMCVDGFLRGGMYRVTATLGLLDAEEGKQLSEDFTGSFDYEALRDVICEWTTAKFFASAGTNAGVNRAGLKSVSEATQGIVTKSQVFIDDATQRKDWVRRLKPFARLIEL